MGKDGTAYGLSIRERRERVKNLPFPRMALFQSSFFGKSDDLIDQHFPILRKDESAPDLLIGIDRHDRYVRSKQSRALGVKEISDSISVPPGRRDGTFR